MPTPLFRLDLTRHLDPVLQLARARPDRVQLVAWAVRYLVENTDGLDVILVERPGTLRPVEVLGAAWLDAVRHALGRESFGDVEAVVGRVTEAEQLSGNPDPKSLEFTEVIRPRTGEMTLHRFDGPLRMFDRHRARRDRVVGVGEPMAPRRCVASVCARALA